MARTYILTKHEREILKRFVETGEKLNGLRNLIYIFRKAKTQLEEDIQLIQTALEKYG
ncbi:hypothetical protein KEJ24_08990 [Candidatus Bathyarchaeota archaeon]|nr:hypothetical protein [Candidatus Bathyarchaeota archaeon]